MDNPNQWYFCDNELVDSVSREIIKSIIEKINDAHKRSDVIWGMTISQCLEIPMGRIAKYIKTVEDDFRRLKRTMRFTEDEYLKAHGGSWGKCQYQDQVETLTQRIRELECEALKNQIESK